MTIKELHNQLKKMGVSEDAYYLHGLYGSINDSEKYALTIRKGKYSIEYEIYYKERDQKNIDRIFTSENEACAYMSVSYTHLTLPTKRIV